MLWSCYLGQVWGFKIQYLGQIKGHYLGQGDFRPIFIVVSGFFAQLSFLCVFLCPIICQFSKNRLFSKKSAKFGFPNFLCFKFNFGKISFFGLLKHYKNRGFSQCLCLFLLEREKNKQKMITGISGFGFCPKAAVSWRTSVFRNIFAETPISIVFSGVRFLAKLSKKGNFGHSTKIWLIIEKLFFGILCFFLFFPFLLVSCFFVFWEVLRVRWGGPKGHLTWP